MKRLLLAALVASLPAQAQNLRMGVGAQITSADPHFHNISPNNAYASMVFDNLLETDAKARLISSLPNPGSQLVRMPGNLRSAAVCVFIMGLISLPRMWPSRWNAFRKC